jgi:trigger factor
VVDEKDGAETATAEPTTKNTLESAVEKVREHKEDKIPFKVLTEENPSGARRKVQVEVDQDQWNSRLEVLFKNVKSQAALPGFRKGKAPLSLLKKRYREGAVNELVEKISPMIIRDYEADKELVVYGTPMITNYEAEEGKPVTITYEMEIKPEIKPANYKGIDVEAPEHLLEDESVDTRLGELREQAAVYDEVDRGWQDGDGVVIDYKITGEKGKTLSHRSNQFIENPKATLPAEVTETLEGKKAGDQFDTVVRELTYSISVKTVKEKKVPEINDDFAKDLGYADEAELRAKTREELEKVVQNTRNDEAFEALTLKLVEAHDFDIPEALKAHVQKEMAETDMQYLRSTGYRPPRLMNVDQMEDYGKVLEKDAVQRVKGFLLIDAIGKQENIEISEEDINKALEAEGAQAGRKPVAVRAALERNKQWARFLEQVRFEKIRDFLLSQNNITYVKQEEKPEAEAGEADAEAEGAESEAAPAKKKPAAKKKAEPKAEATEEKAEESAE